MHEQPSEFSIIYATEIQALIQAASEISLNINATEIERNISPFLELNPLPLVPGETSFKAVLGRFRNAYLQYLKTTIIDTSTSGW